MPSKYYFKLRVNIDKIDSKYGFIAKKKKPITTTTLAPTNTTSLLVNDRPTISYLDETKRLSHAKLTMIDMNNGHALKSLYCFWCRHPIPTGAKPLGCPIKYVPNHVTKTYISEKNNEEYSLSEHVNDSQCRNIEANSEYAISLENYYETDGIFCSFNCCYAFIKSPECQTNTMYKYSESLLMGIFADINGPSKDLIPAPHWRMLVQYGGPLTIDEFRESFNKIDYKYHNYMSCRSIGMLYESRLQLN